MSLSASRTVRVLARGDREHGLSVAARRGGEVARRGGAEPDLLALHVLGARIDPGVAVKLEAVARPTEAIHRTNAFEHAMPAVAGQPAERRARADGIASRASSPIRFVNAVRFS